MNIKDRLESSINDNLDKMGYTKLSHVQREAIPLILDGNNVAVKSSTGSGKTAAFGIPIIQQLLQKQIKGVVVLGPTRELVIQVRDELRRIAKNMPISVIAVYGGHGIEGEIQFLKKNPAIICATPGRFLDHINRGNIRRENYDVVVLDEADKMLSMGFIDDINTILDYISPNNLHLFSATLKKEELALVEKRVNFYETVAIPAEKVKPNITEKEIYLPRKKKFYEFLKIARTYKGRILVFVAMKRFADHLSQRLRERGFAAEAIHGDLSQRKREFVLARFKKGITKILVATDVAARGLQIDNVQCVVNYDPAGDQDTHTHRIGRTGRMGKKGFAYTFRETDAPVRKEVRSTRFYYERGY